MPTISRFFGIEIRMYYEDHDPPHIHAYYQDSAASVDISTLVVLNGSLPKRVYRMILEWAVEHRPALRANWQRAREHQKLVWIEPLE